MIKQILYSIESWTSVINSFLGFSLGFVRKISLVGPIALKPFLRPNSNIFR